MCVACACVRVYVCVRMCACVRMYVRAPRCASVCVYACMHTCVSVRVYACICVRVCVCNSSILYIYGNGERATDEKGDLQTKFYTLKIILYLNNQYNIMPQCIALIP